MKKLVVSFFCLVFIASFSLNCTFAQSSDSQEPISLSHESDSSDVYYVPAKVLDVRDISPPSEKDSDSETFLPDEKVIRLWVQLLSGKFKGKRIFIEHRSGGSWSKAVFPGYDFDHLKKGDRILLYVTVEDDNIKTAHIENHLRSPWLLYLVLAFLLIMIIIAGLKGIKALISIGLTCAGIIWVLLPLILKGYHPIILAILLSIAVALITFVLLNGWSRKTMAAITGTTGGFVIAGFLSYGTGLLANLTGFNSEEASMLRYIPQTVNFNFQGILFAGIIIGALGAIMDVAMSIASSMDELYQHNPCLDFKKHIRAGFNIGKDIIGTMSNTLILAYVGSSIPLLLLFLAYQTPFARVINLDIIATEIVRAVSGSIGLAATIPVTVLVSAFLCTKVGRKKNSNS